MFISNFVKKYLGSRAAGRVYTIATDVFLQVTKAGLLCKAGQ
jgi:hypothetical protein